MVKVSQKQTKYLFRQNDNVLLRGGPCFQVPINNPKSNHVGMSILQCMFIAYKVCLYTRVCLFESMLISMKYV